MITKIEIAGLRGIHEGTLDPLTMLTVIVGPSGAGKSTVLDALLIAASNDPARAVVKVVGRRPELASGGAWLFERAAEASNARATIKIGGDARERTCVLTRQDLPSAWVIEVMATGPHFPSAVRRSVGIPFDGSRWGWERQEMLPPVVLEAPPVHLVEVTEGAPHEQPLFKVYSDAIRRVGRKAVDALLPNLRPGATGLLITTDVMNVPLLSMDMGDHTVPVAALGNGNYALVRLALELACAEPDALVLVEEPEVHQHPEVIYRAARLLLATVKRGVQVVLTTHSLELIDALVVLQKEEALKLDPGALSVIRVALDEKGTLLSSAFSQDLVETARGDMGEDLR